MLPGTNEFLLPSGKDKLKQNPLGNSVLQLSTLQFHNLKFVTNIKLTVGPIFTPVPSSITTKSSLLWITETMFHRNDETQNDMEADENTEDDTGTNFTMIIASLPFSSLSLSLSFRLSVSFFFMRCEENGSWSQND